MREDRAKGFLISFGFTKDAMQEFDPFFLRGEHRVITSRLPSAKWWTRRSRKKPVSPQRLKPSWIRENLPQAEAASRKKRQNRPLEP